MIHPSIFDARDPGFGTYAIPGTPLKLRIRLDGWLYAFDVLDKFDNVDAYMTHDLRSEFPHGMLNAGTVHRMGTWLQARYGFGAGQKAKVMA